MPTFKIILKGIVEGVGMRPAILRYANGCKVAGFVCNHADFVEIILQGSAENCRRFIEHLPENFPPAAQVRLPLDIKLLAEDKIYRKFTIIYPEKNSEKNVALLAMPDAAPCESCLAELHDPGNRHYKFPFISCGKCGPRASVIERLPYERNFTAWGEFPLCPDCAAEYGQIDDRRFHIEGISCPECGPRLSFVDLNNPDFSVESDNASALRQAAELLRQGGVLALKGVGGFQLLVDPENPAAVTKLRRFKQRRAKPLALMAADLAAAQKYFQFSDIELTAFTAPAAPLVILSLKADFTKYNPRLLAPDAPDNLAVMLPASGVHCLLMTEFGKEFVVVSSCNLRGEATVLDFEELTHYPIGFIDGILTHPRKIYFRHDDSILAANGGVMQIWRRARGFKWAALPGTIDERPILALGSEMKNTFAISGNGDLLLSPHHGSLNSVAAVRAWEGALARTVDSLSRKPVAAVVDLNNHNNICRVGEKLALPLIKVQHHYAHARAAAAELQLEEGLILVWDGTGLGEDGTIWGSEFFRLKNGELELAASFESSALPGGEAAIRHPVRQLAARMAELGVSAAEIGKFCPSLSDFEVQMIIKMVRNKINSIHSRGAGRLFDAFAARLNLAPEEIDYEGEAAVRLESAGRGQKKLALKTNFPPYDYLIKADDNGCKLDFSAWFVPDFDVGELAAWRFHFSLAVAAAELAGILTTPGTPVVLCGGVFQNRLLTELLGSELEKRKLIMRLPEQIPPNDGGIAVGQLLEAKRRINRKK